MGPYWMRLSKSNCSNLEGSENYIAVILFGIPSGKAWNECNVGMTLFLVSSYLSDFHSPGKFESYDRCYFRSLVNWYSVLVLSVVQQSVLRTPARYCSDSLNRRNWRKEFRTNVQTNETELDLALDNLIWFCSLYWSPMLVQFLQILWMNYLGDDSFSVFTPKISSWVVSI